MFLLPARGNENDHGDDDSSAYSGTRRDGNFVHVRGLGCDGSHLSALLIRHIFWSNRYVFQRHHADDDALLCRHVLDLELAFG